MKLNEKIIKLRKENGLSQEELGNKIGVSRQAISKWELEQTKPDTDKIKELSNLFNISYDYLLDDTIDEVNNKSKETISKNINKKKYIIIKVIITVFIIYLILSLGKFIALYRYFNIANSFSENNYRMIENYEIDGKILLEHTIIKVGNQRLEENYSYSENNINKSSEKILTQVDYLNLDTDTAYYLILDENDKYQYNDKKKEAIDEEELKNIMNINTGGLKEATLSIIPSNFKDILLNSINPLCGVDIFNNTIYINYLNQMKVRIILTKDCLVKSYSRTTQFDGDMKIELGYDYVQDHFKSKIIEPIETYKDIIVK